MRDTVTTKDVMSFIREAVQSGRVQFCLRHVDTVEGPGADWIETREGLSPLQYLAEEGLIKEKPLHGLSVKNYGLIVDASLGVDHSSLRASMLEVCGVKVRSQI